MYMLISDSKILFRGESSSLDQFKKEYPITDGISGSINEYIEIPTDVFNGLTGYSSQDGTTAGISIVASVPDISGITYSEDFVRGDWEARMDVFGIDVIDNTSLNDGFFSFSNSDVAEAAGDFEIYDLQSSEKRVEIDPRLSPHTSLANIQTIKGLESENQFIEEGLGVTQSISFEMDDGSAEVLTFDNRRDTIVDLLSIKKYSDLNLSIIDTGSQTSVMQTGLQVIDDNGDVFNLSPTEYDRMIYALLTEFYENYLAKIDMKNIVNNPVGTTDREKIDFLVSSSNLSFDLSLNSSFSQDKSGK